MIARARLAALAAVVGSFLAALPAYAQSAPATADTSGSAGGGLIGVWICILVAGPIFIVGGAAAGSLFGKKS
jgi:hypothetical protein